jgi:tRNA A64-2'-O-ribosylphosphate transferase
LNRLNDFLLRDCLHSPALVIVDSTTQGKKFPDAFTRTIPIWVAVVNAARFIVQQQKQAAEQETLPSFDAAALAALPWDDFIHLPSVCSTWERAEIRARLPGFLSAFLSQSGLDVAALVRPLARPFRCAYVNCENLTEFMASNSTESLAKEAHYTLVLFMPSLIVGASDGAAAAAEERGGWRYMQGAADDEGSWARGLTASQFWERTDELLHPESGKFRFLIRRALSEIRSL